ncbi:DUF4307 domain-containing protein [Nocardioides panacisoli]|uniref:DUF4307 domain-containing protein n=1 Tax=Nocardioides panacisoli TaxID=627624 RepID=UPI001C62A1D7|nr:DUF4307 domain-containing protein [Nocardioides panacisoli]QYJ04149.1 DUF4307 domain-containing protein [Nocardioides panacisoli]
MSGTSDSLAERYGAPSPARRALVFALAAALILPASAWLLWVTVSHADPAVASQEIGHEIVGDHTATVTARIKYGDGPVAATCTARAIAADKTVVGEIAFQPTPDQAEHTVELATDRRATTVDWLGCTAEGQPRPR